jgi:hypothetical protein
VRIARLATGAALVGPILYILVGAIPKGNDLDRDTTVFDLDPVWTVATASADDVWTPDFRGFDERSDWTVRVGDQSVEAARFFFVDQRQGEELIQYNNAIAPDSLLASNRVFGPVGPDRRIVQEALLFDDVGPRISWYWYRVAGFDTPFSTNAKLLEIVAFFRRSPAAELVTMSARCAPDDCTDAAKALRAAVGGPEVLEADSTGAADGAEPGG